MAHPGPWGKQATFQSTAVKTKTSNSTAETQKKNMAVMLLWFWPENKKFDLQICETHFGFDNCHLTDNKSLYSDAHGVLIFHRGIQDDLSNLPTLRRPRFQRWIWFNPDTPSNTRKIAGIQGLFNLTLSYRQDADIPAHWKLSARKNTDEKFKLPKKERLLCWITGSSGPHAKSRESFNYYRELVKHIKVDVFYSAEFSKSEDYFLTISSCKFYIAFEESIHRDYITETFNGPVAAGTVPIVLGPSRQNYEEFIPGTAFIHVNDFRSASKLAEFLLKLDKDYNSYIRYFNWRHFYIARPHPIEENYEFAHAICQACNFLSVNKVYRVVPDLNKWFFR
ncbi:4-galactosyl-N-acetylglucosaminide 3-alpha-L-fucosyltransferase 9-like [Notolabrus celidotus]|uniref:4-galactosyl-N-acetylglucosaminide 3-alpha-L-fucosyltransferase 9-like n=1 Tax=Notolabrus celidotus TaxID=1203425 RepID=UPI00148FE7DF|nr:4-galactosyl-N-acetylglucosaminide 3-alpha-L-fucosyltransferase 9-like [Notolabrus celidotus]